MATQAKDLSYDVKQKVLEQIRSQLGYEQYNQLVNSMGEDGLIDVVLTQYKSEAGSKTRSSSPSREENKKSTVQVFFWISFAIALIGGAIFPDGKVLESTVSNSYGTIFVILLVIAILLLIISAIAGSAISFVEHIYWIAPLACIPLGWIVNLFSDGLIVILITLILFAVIFLFSRIFAAPAWILISRISNRIIAYTLYTIEVIVYIAASVLGLAGIFNLFTR